MLCINGTDLAKIEQPLQELLHNRQHLDLHEDDRAMLETALKVCEEVREIVASDEEREAAANLHATDDLEIDDEASVSRADDGYWVSAWVWVPERDEAEDEDGFVEPAGPPPILPPVEGDAR